MAMRCSKCHRAMAGTTPFDGACACGGLIEFDSGTERDEILKRFSVDAASGRIKSPGKFEGEMLYVPYFWGAYLEGMADRDDGRVLGFDITPEDRAKFPELGKRRRTVKLVEREDGFVVEV